MQKAAMDAPMDAALVRQLIETGMPGAKVSVLGEDGVRYNSRVA